MSRVAHRVAPCPPTSHSPITHTLCLTFSSCLHRIVASSLCSPKSKCSLLSPLTATATDAAVTLKLNQKCVRVELVHEAPGQQGSVMEATDTARWDLHTVLFKVHNQHQRVCSCASELEQQRTSGTGSCTTQQQKEALSCGAIRHCDKRLWPLQVFAAHPHSCASANNSEIKLFCPSQLCLNYCCV